MSKGMEKILKEFFTQAASQESLGWIEIAKHGGGRLRAAYTRKVHEELQ